MKFGWRGALGVIISVACLYYAFHQVPLAKALDVAKHVNLGWLSLGAVCATGMFPLRARRWRTILDPIAPKLPLGPLWRSTAIGMMVNNVVPLRAGELARAYALTREVPSISFSESLASLVVDRVFDAIVVLLLLAVSVLASNFAPDVTIGGRSLATLARGFVIVPLLVLCALYALVFFPNALIRVFELCARRVSPAIERRGSEMLREFAAGLSVLKTPGHFIAVFWWTLLHWLLQPFAFWLGFKAVGIDVPWPAALFVQGVIVIGVALPSAPGFVGVFETAATIALAVYKVSAVQALAWAVVFHIASFIPITLIGAYYFARMGIRLGDVGSAASASG